VGLPLAPGTLREAPDKLPPHLDAGHHPVAGRLPLHRLVPWFLLGFLACSGDLQAHTLKVTGSNPVSVTVFFHDINEVEAVSGHPAQARFFVSALCPQRRPRPTIAPTRRQWRPPAVPAALRGH